MVRSPSAREQKVLVLSADLSELLILRRLVLETPFGVDTARSLQQARELLLHQNYAAAVVDDSLPGDARAALDDLEMRRPDMHRVLLCVPDATPHPRAEVVRRPYYAPALRTWLLELALRLVELDASDDTLPTGPPRGEE